MNSDQRSNRPDDVERLLRKLVPRAPRFHESDIYPAKPLRNGERISLQLSFSWNVAVACALSALISAGVTYTVMLRQVAALSEQASNSERAYPGDAYGHATFENDGQPQRRTNAARLPHEAWKFTRADSELPLVVGSHLNRLALREKVRDQGMAGEFLEKSQDWRSQPKPQRPATRATLLEELHSS